MKTKYNSTLKIILLITLFSAGHFDRLSAQNFDFIPSGYHDYYFQPKNVGIVTPQSADFQRYGNLNIDHYNGMLNMDIALDGYQDKDFDIPLSIKYVSQGFMPSKRPSIVGVNWFLDFGGVITRTVKGSPDDTKGNYVSDKRKYIKDGFLAAMRNGTYVQHSESVLTSFTMPLNSSYHTSGDLKYDMEPDIFHFNFGKHQGRFFIGNTGNPICLSGNGYKIDISGLAIQSYSTTATPVTSTIKITTPDGYVYEFGGNTSYLEYNIPNNPDKAAVSPRYILSWYLKSITSPNNRQVTFTYNSRLLPNHYNYYLYSEIKSASQTPGGPVYGSTEEKPQKIEVRDKVYSPIIQKMTIDGAELRFTTTTTVPFFDAGDPSYCLSKVSLFYNSQLVKESHFRYETKGKYVFLSALKRNDEVYGFNYYSINPPSPLTTSVDHWGFWNGGYDTDVTNIKTYCENVTSTRESKSSVQVTGLLQSVLYPTGGKTEILYQKNTYDRYIEKYINWYGLYLRTLQSSAYCGGARVFRITDYDPVTGKSYNERTYEYKIPGTNTGSGIIFGQPKYETMEYFRGSVSGGGSSAGLWVDIKDISANSLGFRENYPEYHIGYSDVLERFSDGSYNHYQYSSHADMPNTLNGVNCKITNEFPVQSANQRVLEKIGLYITNDLSHFRGKLKRKIVYHSSGLTQQIIDYTYNFTSAEENYNTCVASAHRGFSYYRLYSTPCLLKTRVIVDKNYVVHTENYEYNSNHFLSRKKLTNSDGINHTMDYKYPVDYSYSSLTAAVKSMVDKNMLTKPMRIIKNIQRGTSTPLATDAIVFEYKTENGFPVVDKIKELKTETPVAETSSAFNSNLVIKESYEKYDVYGNPVHIVKDGIYNTVFLWGYKGRYPVAEIKNASYTDVKTALSNVAPESLSTATQPDTVRINALRNSLPQASISTYTHAPFVGLTSVAEPNSQRQTYGYNQHGQLSAITNYKQQVINDFSYNFSQLFNFNITGLNVLYLNDRATYGINITEGSGIYEYSWELKRSGQTISNGTDASTNISFTTVGTYYLYYTVNDVLYNKTLTKMLTITVSERPVIIKFINSQTSSNQAAGTYTISADIDCARSMTVTLEHGLTITGNSGATSVGYTISSYTPVTLNSNTTTTRTYTLYQGLNKIYITGYKGNASFVHGWLKITGASTGTIGTPPSNSLDLRY